MTTTALFTPTVGRWASTSSSSSSLLKQNQWTISTALQELHFAAANSGANGGEGIVVEGHSTGNKGKSTTISSTAGLASIWSEITKADLRQAYRKRVLLVHPDRNTSADVTPTEAAEAFNRLTSAFKFATEMLDSGASFYGETDSIGEQGGEADNGNSSSDRHFRAGGSSSVASRSSPLLEFEDLMNVLTNAVLKDRNTVRAEEEGERVSSSNGSSDSRLGRRNRSTGDGTTQASDHEFNTTDVSLRDLALVGIAEGKSFKTIEMFQDELPDLLTGGKTFKVYLDAAVENGRQQASAASLKYIGQMLPQMVARVVKKRQKLFSAANKTAAQKANRGAAFRSARTDSGQEILTANRETAATGSVNLHPLALLGCLILTPPSRHERKILEQDDYSVATSSSMLRRKKRVLKTYVDKALDELVVSGQSKSSDEEEEELVHNAMKMIPASARKCCPELRCVLPLNTSLSYFVSEVLRWEQESLKRLRLESSIKQSLEVISAELSLNPPLAAVPYLHIPTSEVERVAEVLSTHAISIISAEADSPLKQGFLPFAPDRLNLASEFRPIEGGMSSSTSKFVQGARLQRQLGSGESAAFFDEAERENFISMKHGSSREVQRVLKKIITRLDLTYEKEERFVGAATETTSAEADADEVLRLAATEIEDKDPKADDENKEEHEATKEEEEKNGNKNAGGGVDEDEDKVVRRSVKVRRPPNTCIAEEIRFEVSVPLSNSLTVFLRRIGAALYKVLEVAERSESALPDLISTRNLLTLPPRDSGRRPIWCFPQVFGMDGPAERLFWLRCEESRDVILAQQPQIRPWSIVFVGDQDSIKADMMLEEEVDVDVEDSGDGDVVVGCGWTEDQPDTDIVTISRTELLHKDAFVRWLSEAMDYSAFSKKIYEVLLEENLREVISRDEGVDLKQFLGFLENFRTSPARAALEGSLGLTDRRLSRYFENKYRIIVKRAATTADELIQVSNGTIHVPWDFDLGQLVRLLEEGPDAGEEAGAMLTSGK